MAAVSETIVREYFELHEFLVRQHRKYITQARREDDDIDFFVLNPQPARSEHELPFLLSSKDLKSIERAVVARAKEAVVLSFPVDAAAEVRTNARQGQKILGR